MTRTDVSDKTVEKLGKAAQDFSEESEDKELDKICAYLDKGYVPGERKFFWEQGKQNSSVAPSEAPKPRA